MRELPEWIAKHDDEAIPPRVRARVFERFGGVCQVAKRKIRSGEPWQCDHILALCNGGEHREKNLQPILVDKHREKTREDVRVKSKIARVKARHLGIRKPKQKIASRGFSGWKKFDGSLVRVK